MAGPDGNLWFAEEATQKLGVVTPTINMVVTTEPPASVAANAPFSLTVSFDYLTGLPDTAYSGTVTLGLLIPGGATLGGTLTATARNGVATFTGLTIDQAGDYQITAFSDPLNTVLTTPVTVAAPRTVTPTPTSPTPTPTDADAHHADARRRRPRLR